MVKVWVENYPSVSHAARIKNVQLSGGTGEGDACAILIVSSGGAAMSWPKSTITECLACNVTALYNIFILRSTYTFLGPVYPNDYFINGSQRVSRIFNMVWLDETLLYVLMNRRHQLENQLVSAKPAVVIRIR